MSPPPTRNEVLEIARGYQPACILTAAADWDVFTALSESPRTASALASRLGTDERATTRLLDALTAMSFLVKDGDTYRVPVGVTELLSETGRDSILPMVRHQANCLRRWAQLSTVMQTGGPAVREPGPRGEAADQEAFIGAMHNVSAPVADRLVSEIGPPSFQHMLDIGGASGTWTLAFLRAMAQATATIFDLPHVIPMAQQRIEASSLRERIHLASGDFYTDELPAGADLVWLSAIAHQNSRAQNQTLFRKIHDALAEGGLLLIRDLVMDESHTHPPGGTFFAINMLVGTDAGGTYSFDEYREDLMVAGFAGIEQIRKDAWMDAIIQARKP